MVPSRWSRDEDREGRGFLEGEFPTRYHACTHTHTQTDSTYSPTHVLSVRFGERHTSRYRTTFLFGISSINRLRATSYRPSQIAVRELDGGIFSLKTGNVVSVEQLAETYAEIAFLKRQQRCRSIWRITVRGETSNVNVYRSRKLKMDIFFLNSFFFDCTSSYFAEEKFRMDEINRQWLTQL